MEPSLKDSELRYRRLFEAAQDGILILDAETGLIEDVNPYLIKMLGYSREEFLEKKLWEVGAFKDIKASKEAFETLQENEYIRYEDLPLKTKDRRLIQVEFISNVYLVGDEKVIQCNIRDITVRRHAEEALLKAGALQNAIFNSANFSSIATDAKGVIQIFNVGAERMLGYTAADVMNKITPADISDPQEVIARARALSIELETTITPGFEALVFKASRGIEDIYELTYIRKDGSRFPAIVSVTALRDPQDAIIGYLLIGTDNTARKQVEAEQKLLDQRLRNQQFYTRSLIESNIDALMTTDPSGIITDVNKQMEALTGCTRDELIGAPFKNYFTDPERAEAGIKMVLSEKKVTDYELTAQDMNGKKTLVSYNATTYYDRDRKLQGVFAAARDITDRKHAEEQLRLLNVDLERRVEERTVELVYANHIKDEFLANMSHELRTPLTGILGLSENLLADVYGALIERQKLTVQVIQSSGEHLLELINDILDISKIEAGKFEFSLEEVKVDKICQSSLVFIKQQANKKSITVEYSSLENVFTVFADPRRLKQILINLLINAVKFTSENGKVKLEVQADVQESLLRFSITDTGIGISPEDLLKLFKPFVQLDSGLSRQYEGSGLGLALVKNMVEMHGGSVNVQSKPGQGSCFSFVLPWNEKIQAGNALDLLEGGHEMRDIAVYDISKVRGKVLLAEDHETNILATRDYLESRGYQVFIARDGREVLSKANEAFPDIILMDIQMPNLNGFDATRRLRADPRFATLPIIALTAFAMSGDRERCLDAGMNEYLSKPFKLKELEQMIEQFLHPFSG
jgi:PAS domain S-box-containing protein